MRVTTASMSLAAAVIILAVAAEAALSQQPKSTKRIPITKEAAGEIVRVDTVMRVDTVTRTIFRTDTMTVTRTMMRVDTVVVAPPPIPIRLPAGFYLGVAAGSSAPDGSIYIPNSVGYVGQAQIGWQNAKQAFGGRVSGTYTNLGQDSQFSLGNNGQLWTISTDAKLNLPLGHVFGMTPRLAAYGIGGWTYTWYKDLPRRLSTPDNTPPVFALGDDSWTGRNGWDAGGGLALMWGRSEVFVESRVLGFTLSSSPQGRQIPIVLGFNWY